MPAIINPLDRKSSRECWHRPDRVKRCAMCEETKPLAEFYAYGYTNNQGNRGTRYESRCMPCARARRRGVVSADPARYAAESKAWRERNPGRSAERAREYRQTEHGRAVKAKLQRLRKARMRSGQGDNEAIRAIYAEAIRIEQVTAKCPVFDIPELGHRMHVDHIKPLSKGGEHHQDNLQIIPIGINMRKGVKCPL